MNKFIRQNISTILNTIIHAAIKYILNKTNATECDIFKYIKIDISLLPTHKQWPLKTTQIIYPLRFTSWLTLYLSKSYTEPSNNVRQI